MTKNTDVEKAQQLVQDVIIAQSNTFIKELLIKRGIRGGANKAEFQEQLDAAIIAGTLSYEELRDWVADTEGWGDEHIYLYSPAEPLHSLLSDEQRIRQRIKKAGLEYAFGADSSLAFPEERTLTGIQLTDGELTFVWHQGTGAEKRSAERDFERIEDDDERYVYKAYRETRLRSVTRVVAQPRLLAVFVPSASEPKTHAEERASLAEEIEKVVSFGDWELFSMNKAIRLLDGASMRTKRRFAEARTTRFAAIGGGHVEFASDTDRSYADVEPLREVRKAVTASKFKGTDGDFRFILPAPGGSSGDEGSKEGRPVRVQLYAAHDRVRTWAKLTRGEAWWIINKIPKRHR